MNKSLEIGREAWTPKLRLFHDNAGDHYFYGGGRVYSPSASFIEGAIDVSDQEICVRHVVLVSPVRQPALCELARRQLLDGLSLRRKRKQELRNRNKQRRLRINKRKSEAMLPWAYSHDIPGLYRVVDHPGLYRKVVAFEATELRAWIPIRRQAYRLVRASHGDINDALDAVVKADLASEIEDIPF